ncbi:putative folate-biopterin transporter 2 [Nymphaea thermarum]|nr:putative folate-biopterin transporter 2 [Nymphaea thermarum]
MGEEEMGKDGEEETLVGSDEVKEKRKAFLLGIASPVLWLRMLANEMHCSFVAGVIVVYGVGQGIGGSLNRLASDYYWKDVQMVQPSAAQVYQGITGFPWMVKPLWGLLTDVLPIFGYRRRPYFVFAGIIGVFSMLLIALHKQLHVLFALLALIGGSAGAAIADVTIDACVAQNSIHHPPLAADMQSLCGFSSSIGALLGFSVSGFLVHHIGAQVYERLLEAAGSMWKTLKCPVVWRPCLYMYFSLALSLNIHEGMFYWYTDSKSGPSFSQEIIGFIYCIGAVGSLLGVLLYHNILKNYSFRSLLFWSQLLYGLSGMLDLALVLRLNLKYNMPDYLFVVIDEGVSQMINRIKWLPLLVLGAKLCPTGIEGTFFALLMSIDNIGVFSSSWGGGLLLHILNVTRTEFSNLWVAIILRNLLRLLPLSLLFLVPKSDNNSQILPTEFSSPKEAIEMLESDKI